MDVRRARDAATGRRGKAQRDYRARLKQEAAWEAAISDLLDALHAGLNLHGAIEYAARSWVKPPDDPSHGVIVGTAPGLLKRLWTVRPEDVATAQAWAGARGQAATEALALGSEGYAVRALRGPNGDLEAVVATREVRGSLEVGRMVVAPNSYAGARVMQEVASTAASQGLGVRAQPAAGTEGFFQGIGMVGGDWSHEQAREFAQTGGYQSPGAEDLKARLATGVDSSAWIAGAVQVYVGLAGATGAVSGQAALESLGLNKTWAWAHPRNMANDLFATRGSKIVQAAYGAHLERLQSIIAEATDPRTPKSISEVTRQVRQEWPTLRRYQAERIARTETAAAWSTVSANAYAANGISQFESMIATGPSIGVETEDPCDECVDAAAEIHSLDDDLPPWHPNCRCEIIPVLEGEDGQPWLPPAEPWGGGDLPVYDGSTTDMGLGEPPPVEEQYLSAADEPVPAPRRIEGGSDEARAMYDDVSAEDVALPAADPALSQIREALSDARNEMRDASVYVVQDAEGTVRGAMHVMHRPDVTRVLNVGSRLKGGGTAMLRVAARDAVDRGVAVELNSLPQSLGFYRKLGFEGEGTSLRLEGDPLRQLASKPGETGHSAPPPATPPPPLPAAPDPASFDVTSYTAAELADLTTGDLWRAMSRNGHAQNLARADITLEQDRLIADELWSRVGGEDVERGLPEGTLRYSDLNGERHVHSTYSDGHNSIREMAEEARSHGQQRITISDHSHLMTPESIERQHAEIDAINSEYERRGLRFRVRKGIEVNILEDGTLDLTDAQLAQFDDVNAGMHAGREDATREVTARYLKVLNDDHPNLTTLAHPHTGGDNVNWSALAKKAKEKGVALEVNGRDILRRDTAVAARKMIAAARRAGVKLQIGSDAHNTVNVVDSLYATRFAAKEGVQFSDLMDEQRVLDDVSLPGEPPIGEDYLRVIKRYRLDAPDAMPAGSKVKKLLGKSRDTRDLHTNVEGEYDEVAEKAHDGAVAHFLEGHATQEKPVALVTAGGPAAGKSVARRANPGMDPEDAVVINPDDIMPMLEDFTAVDGDPGMAAALHEEASDVAVRLFREALAKRTNVVVDGCGNAGPSKFLAKLRDLKKAGYEVRIVMSDAPTNTAIERSVQRAVAPGSPDLHRFLPIKELKTLYRDAVRRMPEWMDSKYVDSWKLMRSGGEWGDVNVSTVAQGGGGKHEILLPDQWKAVQAKADYEID